MWGWRPAAESDTPLPGFHTSGKGSREGRLPGPIESEVICKTEHSRIFQNFFICAHWFCLLFAWPAQLRGSQVLSLLFHIYINDIGSGVTSNISKFADDTKNRTYN